MGIEQYLGTKEQYAARAAELARQEAALKEQFLTPSQRDANIAALQARFPGVAIASGFRVYPSLAPPPQQVDSRGVPIRHDPRVGPANQQQVDGWTPGGDHWLDSIDNSKIGQMQYSPERGFYFPTGAWNDYTSGSRYDQSAMLADPSYDKSLKAMGIFNPNYDYDRLAQLYNTLRQEKVQLGLNDGSFVTGAKASDGTWNNIFVGYDSPLGTNGWYQPQNAAEQAIINGAGADAKAEMESRSRGGWQKVVVPALGLFAGLGAAGAFGGSLFGAAGAGAGTAGATGTAASGLGASSSALGLGGGTAAAGLGTGTAAAGLGVGTAATSGLFTAAELASLFPGAFGAAAGSTLGSLAGLGSNTASSGLSTGTAAPGLSTSSTAAGTTNTLGGGMWDDLFSGIGDSFGDIWNSVENWDSSFLGDAGSSASGWDFGPLSDAFTGGGVDPVSGWSLTDFAANPSGWDFGPLSDSLLNGGIDPVSGMTLAQLEPGLWNTLTNYVTNNPGSTLKNAYSLLTSGGAAGGTNPLGSLLSSGLGAYASNQQTKALQDQAQRYEGYGAPYRQKLSDLYTNPSSFLTSPEVTTSVDQGTSALMRSLSTKGNPFGSGNALQQGQSYATDQLFGKLGQEKDRLAGFGGLTSYNAAAPQASSNAINSSSNMWNALGSGAANIFNPPKTQAQTMADFYKLLGQQA